MSDHAPEAQQGLTQLSIDKAIQEVRPILKKFVLDKTTSAKPYELAEDVRSRAEGKVGRCGKTLQASANCPAEIARQFADFVRSDLAPQASHGSLILP